MYIPMNYEHINNINSMYIPSNVKYLNTQEPVRMMELAFLVSQSSSYLLTVQLQF